MPRDELRDLFNRLAPEARARLLAINPRLRAHVEKAQRRGGFVEATARRDGDVVILVAKGLRLSLLPNALKGMHPQKEARLRRREHEAIRGALAAVAPPPSPWRVTITRLGPVPVDSDAAWTSAKGVRDEVAAWGGVDDGSSLYDWRVLSEVARGYAVRVQVEHV